MIQLENENLCIGLKASMRAIKEGRAKIVLLAKDADQHVLRPITQLAEQHAVAIEYISSKKALGQLCHIDVGAAAAVIIIDLPSSQS